MKMKYKSDSTQEYNSHFLCLITHTYTHGLISKSHIECRTAGKKSGFFSSHTHTLSL